MTTPVVHGYPDWIRQAARADVVYLNVSEAITATKVHPRKFVGATPCIGISLESLDLRCQVTLNWYSAETGGIFLKEEVFTVGPSGMCAIQIATAGPWVEAQVAFPTPGTLNYELRLWSADVPRILFFTDPGAPILIAQAVTNIAAGVTTTIESPFTVPGLAHLQVFATMATWDGGLQAINILGVTYRLATLDQRFGLAPVLIYLPAMPVQFSIHNSTGALGTFAVSLIAHSIGQA